MDTLSDRSSIEESIVVPPGILSTCHGTNRRSNEVKTEQTDDHGRRRIVSMLISSPEQPSGPGQDPSTLCTAPSETVVASAQEDDGLPRRRPISGSGGPQAAVVDFAQLAEHHDAVEANSEKRNTGIGVARSPDKEPTEEYHSSDRSSTIFKRLSYVARSFVGSRRGRSSTSNDGQSIRYSVQSRPSHDGYDFSGYPDAKISRKRDSRVIPKSWKFLGIDGPGVGDAVSNVANKLRPRNFRDMYEKAKIKQQKIKRSNTAQLIFRYTFYVLLVATVYLLLIGLPLWRGLVWYMYILFEKHLVLKAGLTITFGLGFL